MKPLCKTITRPDQRLFIAGSAAVLALAVMGFAGSAHARENVVLSVGIGVPGVQVGVTNAYPVYTQPRPVYVQAQPLYVQAQPIYVQAQPVYVQIQPVYVQPAPVYYQPQFYYRAHPVYVQPQPVHFGRPHGWHGHRGDREHGEGRSYRSGYGPIYAPVYYQR